MFYEKKNPDKYDERLLSTFVGAAERYEGIIYPVLSVAIRWAHGETGDTHYVVQFLSTKAHKEPGVYRHGREMLICGAKPSRKLFKAAKLLSKNTYVCAPDLYALIDDVKKISVK